MMGTASEHVMTIRIAPMEPQHVASAKRVIITVVCELFAGDTSPCKIDQSLVKYEAAKQFADIDEFEEHYFSRNGIFLVLLDDAQVVGTGGLRPLHGSIAELKRMWFLPPYRGRGLGRNMAEHLLQFARSVGYTHVRLDTGHTQTAAL